MVKMIPSPAPLDTETRILRAALDEFASRGLGGARMQAIADRAGVNKALLHYYFRSKDHLYRATIGDFLRRVWTEVMARLKQDRAGDDLLSLLRAIVSSYVLTMKEHPHFVRIFLRELAEEGGILPEILRELVAGDFAALPPRLFAAFGQAAKRGHLRVIPPEHFILNLLGMVAATFFAQPLLAKAGPAFTGRKFTFDPAFYQARIEIIMHTIQHGMLHGGK